ncbi:MAG TPA: hypothetical protein PKN50_15565, partial [Spirochaetota bacterium]|nr:hypothetical protein [Spirochaetota bacterium]
MRYIKIRGNNYNEVMMKLKMEHGDDAIPISHKFVKEGGLFNSKLFAKEVVELTAAVQERKMKSGFLGEKKKKIDFTVDDGDAGVTDLGRSRVSDVIDRPAPPAAAAGSDRMDTFEKRPAGFTFNEKLNEVYTGIAEHKKTAPAPEPVRTPPPAEPAEEARKAEPEQAPAGGVRFEK